MFQARAAAVDGQRAQRLPLRRAVLRTEEQQHAPEEAGERQLEAGRGLRPEQLPGVAGASIRAEGL